MSKLRDFVRILIALPAVFLGMALLKIIALMEEIYPLRKRLVRRGYLGYTSPDSAAIRECAACGYIGVLNVDKHEYAPMSDTNWGLHCPDCGTEIQGPIHIDSVAEYINLCRSSDVIGGVAKIGGYGAFKTVQAHNSRYALPLEKVRELEEAEEAA
jgi:hypothetical protein